MVSHTDSLEHINGDQRQALVFKCLNCGGPVEIDWIELKHTGGLVRKATCLDAKCATRVFQRSKMAQKIGSCKSKFDLFCPKCEKSSGVLYLSKSGNGMVCPRCFEEGR